jgi:hypothetical protein
VLVIVRSPRSDDPLARAHGRVDAAATAATLLLVVASSFLESLSATVFITLVCLANASQLYGYLVYLPYYRLAMNHLKVACASALVWASVCMAMAQFHGKPQVCTSTAWVSES